MKKRFKVKCRKCGTIFDVESKFEPKRCMWCGTDDIWKKETPSRGKWLTGLNGNRFCSQCGYDATYDSCGVEVLGICCTYCGAVMDLECADDR